MAYGVFFMPSQSSTSHWTSAFWKPECANRHELFPSLFAVLLLLLFKTGQKLLDILLAKCHLIVIDHQTWDAHDLVALL